MALSYTDKAKYWGDFPGHLLIQTESNLVSPKREWTKSIRSNVPIAASMLNFQDHFEMESIDDETWKEVVDHLSTYCRSVATTNDNVKMVLRIPETATAMMKKYYLLEEERICSEAELRYAMGDPIMELLCKTWGLKIRLEESAKKSDATTIEMAVSPPQSSTATPRSKGVHGSISKDVRQDYTCYYIYSQDNRSVAVVIEAKLQKNSTYKNVIPQAIGYYIALGSMSPSKPPIAIIITEDGVQILFFPFRGHEKEALINAVALNPMRLWIRGNSKLLRIQESVLELMLLLACPFDNVHLQFFTIPDGMHVVKKVSLEPFVEESNTRREQELTEENMKMKAELDKKNEKIKEMGDTIKKLLKNVS